MKNKILTLVVCLSLVVAVVCFVACSGTNKDSASANAYNREVDYSYVTADLTGKTLKVGAILVGDETEGYTEAHMKGMTAAKQYLEGKGATITIINKKKVPEGPECATACSETIAQGANVVITNSYGHQFNVGEVVAANPNVTFVCMTGDLAAGSGYSNLKNAFTKVYESRYVSGVVAGLKLKELVDAGKLTAANYDSNNNIKIGYVGAYNYAEVVSGYTAFYLGLKSVVNNIVMKVQYTNEWFEYDKEYQTAKALIADGCVIIGQHADSEGAPTACQEELENGKVVYSVGYNVDMLKAAEDASLTSSTNTWAAYYTYLFYQLLTEGEVKTDWAEGYSTGAVGITTINDSAFSTNIKPQIKSVVDDIVAGNIKVFDCSKFTVNNEHLTTYTGAYGMNGAECLKTENGVTFFDESTLRSAPYFDIRIDGITEVGAASV